jgi:hypothetical protein
VLVVVEYGDVTFFFELALDFKAAGCRDILQIDSAEGARDQIHCINKFIDVFAFDA